MAKSIAVIYFEEQPRLAYQKPYKSTFVQNMRI